jgi:von Willebrand factor type A domain
VTVRCDQTEQTWTINLIANTVPRPRSEVAIVLDRSGSMSEDAGDGTTKVQKMREAVGVFLDAMLPGDGVGIVRFDDTVQRLMNISDVGPLGTGAGRAAAIGHVMGSGLDPAGATSIGGGVVEGKNTLDDGQAAAAVPYAVQAMVVLTDGVENTPPMLSGVGSSITARTFAIGLGMPYNISVAALNALTQGNNGYLLVTGALTADQRTRLTKYFLQVLAGITNANVVVDPSGWIGRGDEHRLPFQLTQTDYAFDAYVLTPAPHLLDWGLEAPDGTRFDAGSLLSLGTGQHVARNGMALYRVALPVDPGAPDRTHEGVWHVVIRLGRLGGQWGDQPLTHAVSSAGHLPYNMLVHCYSNLVFLASASQAGFEPGATVTLAATLREYDVPVGDRAVVWAEVTSPARSQFIVPLQLGADRTYRGSFATVQPGVYTARVRARGSTFRGMPFTREQTLTAVARPAGSGPGAPEEDPVRELVCCLLTALSPSDEVWKRLASAGVDTEQLRACMRRLCASPGDRERRRPRTAATDLRPEVVLDWLRQQLR